MTKPITMTVADLKDELSRLNNSDELYFGNGDLRFYRMKYRGDKLVSLEFNQIYCVTHDPEDEDS